MLKSIILSLSLLLTGAVCVDAPEISLSSTNGQYIELSDYKGKVVVVSYWATWCKPCILELKFLNKLAKEYKNDLVVLAVSTDGPNTQAQVNSIIHSKRLRNLIVLLDSTGETNLSSSIPYSIYINREGKQCSEHSGFIVGDDIEIKKKVLTLIGDTNVRN